MKDKAKKIFDDLYSETKFFIAFDEKGDAIGSFPGEKATIFEGWQEGNLKFKPGLTTR